MTLAAKQYIIRKGGGTASLVIKDTQVPEPANGEVLVIVHAVSLQYRDLVIADGTYPLPAKDEMVPCSDGAGEIVKLGPNVIDFKVGDRVCANFELDRIAGDANEKTKQTALGGAVDGMLTQYRVLPVHSLVKIPDHLNYEEASTLPCAALTAYNALMGPVKLKGGDIVLVQGTGGVSIFALQMAVASGAIVIATSSNNEKLQIAKKLGARHVINYREKPDWDKEVLRLTGGHGADHIIEVGGPNTMRRSLGCVAYSGWIHSIGFLSAAEGEDTGNIAMGLLGKNAYLRGVLIGSVHHFEDMNQLLTAAQIHPVIDKVFPFDQAKEAYDYLLSQKHVGKVVIKVAN